MSRASSYPIRTRDVPRIFVYSTVLNKESKETAIRHDQYLTMSFFAQSIDLLEGEVQSWGHCEQTPAEKHDTKFAP